MEKQRDHCIRCGECCLSSSPTLQREDIPLVGNGVLEKHNLYTVRKGEVVRDNIQSQLIRTDKEFVKIREKENGKGCIFYSETAKACGIYEHRPAQCAALACWDTHAFLKVHEHPKATRKEIVQDKVLLGLMTEHSKRCDYGKLDACVKAIEREGERAVERILELMKFDYHLRPFISKKLALDSNEMDFHFGRPLVETVRMFGLKVTQEPDGSFFLSLSDPAPATRTAQ